MFTFEYEFFLFRQATNIWHFNFFGSDGKRILCSLFVCLSCSWLNVINRFRNFNFFVLTGSRTSILGLNWKLETLKYCFCFEPIGKKFCFKALLLEDMTDQGSGFFHFHQFTVGPTSVALRWDSPLSGDSWFASRCCAASSCSSVLN